VKHKPFGLDLKSSPGGLISNINPIKPLFGTVLGRLIVCSAASRDSYRAYGDRLLFHGRHGNALCRDVHCVSTILLTTPRVKVGHS